MNSMSDIFCRVPCFVAVQKNPVGYKQQLSRSVEYAGHGSKTQNSTQGTQANQNKTESLNTDTDLDTQT